MKGTNYMNMEFVNDYTVIAEWILKQSHEEFDGIYEIKFNANLECVYFKSWEMVK